MDTPRIAIMWRADWRAPANPTHYEARLAPIADALKRAGLEVEPIAYREEDAPSIRQCVLDCDGVLVWINPLADGRDRRAVDALLREAAAAGIWVSANPDVIQKMGTKEVLYTTRSLSWGSDVDLYATSAEFDRRFPKALARGPRVLKPRRGNDGRNVIRVEAVREGYRVRHANDDVEEDLSAQAFADRVAALFAQGGAIIDQECHLRRGMVRCYMSLDRVVGFAEQEPRAERGSGFAMRSAKTMHPAEASEFTLLRRAMEAEWTPGLLELLNLRRAELPALWDADFLWRARPTPSPFALCEINASCVSPFPPGAPDAIAANVIRAMRCR